MSERHVPAGRGPAGRPGSPSLLKTSTKDTSDQVVHIEKQHEEEAHDPNLEGDRVAGPDSTLGTLRPGCSNGTFLGWAVQQRRVLNGGLHSYSGHWQLLSDWRSSRIVLVPAPAIAVPDARDFFA